MWKRPRKELTPPGPPVPVTSNPKAGLHLADEIVTAIEDNAFLENCVWTNVGGKNLKVRGVSFRYGTFNNCYFHASEFSDCDFTGCKFIRCNFPVTQFVSCDFQYAYFEFTNIEKESVLHNEPSRPNVARDLYRNLRINSLQLGHLPDANIYIDRELRANSEFLRRALFNLEEYYREKYPFWPYKPKMFLKYIANWLGRMLWGHGESFWKLILATLLVTVGVATADWLFNSGLRTVGPPFASDLAGHIGHGMAVLSDLNAGQTNDLSVWATLLITLLRYVSLGLAFSILFRRNSYR